MRNESEVFRRLRDHVIGRIHIGQLHAGDQLPSYRALSAAWNVDHRAIARAYKALESEGLVEIRGRSGVYVAPQERIAGGILPETARWAAEQVLTEAWRRRIPIPDLPEFIRHCTASVKIRVACIAGTEDHRHLLSTELKTWFGFVTTSVPVSAVTSSIGTPGGANRPNTRAQALRAADLLVTFGFHAPAVRALAEALEKPYVVATLHPAGLEIIRRHLDHERLTLVCVDPGLGERLKSVVTPAQADSIRVVLTRDTAVLDRLDPGRESLLVSTAARARLRRNLPSILNNVPSLSQETAAELSHLLIRLNLQSTDLTGG